MSLSLSSSIDDPNLLTAVEQLISAHPESEPVIQRLIAYYNAKLGTTTDGEEREHKKRKIDTGSDASSLNIQATISDVSFQIPARKKYNLITTPTHLILANPKTNEADFTYQLQDFELGACVPNPGATKGDTYVLFLKSPDTDPVVFSIQQKGPLVIKRGAVENSVDSDSKRDTLVKLLTTEAGIRISMPEKHIYRSTMVSSSTGKPSEEDKFHANAYLKAKEGSLYFLPDGILYGFKKPTIFFPLSCIASSHFCGIMQHTFNITLVLDKDRRPLGSAFSTSNKDDEETTVEFSMIEQSEYGGIDAYIKKIGINDKSMSAEHRAPEVKTSKNAEDPANKEDNEENDEDFRPSDDDEESDHDFHPSDGEEDPLEYDSEAGSSVDMEAEDGEEEEEEDGDVNNAVEVDLEQASGSDQVEGASEQDVLVSEDEEEQDITRTDNETDDHELGEEDLEEEEELVEYEDEDEDDDDRSESLGSSSDQDIDEEMHDASIGDDAKDELDDSD